MSLLEAIKSASPERIVEAFKAAIHAAHTNNPSHGHAAALAVLEVAEPESAPVAAEALAAEPKEVELPLPPADVPGVVA